MIKGIDSDIAADTALEQLITEAKASGGSEMANCQLWANQMSLLNARQACLMVFGWTMMEDYGQALPTAFIVMIPMAH